MGIMGIHAIPMMITCMLQGTLCALSMGKTFAVWRKKGRILGLLHKNI